MLLWKNPNELLANPMWSCSSTMVPNRWLCLSRPFNCLLLCPVVPLSSGFSPAPNPRQVPPPSGSDLSSLAAVSPPSPSSSHMLLPGMHPLPATRAVPHPVPPPSCHGLSLTHLSCALSGRPESVCGRRVGKCFPLPNWEIWEGELGRDPRAPRPCPISHAITDISDRFWEEVEEEDDDLEEEEDDDDDDEDIDMFLEETPVKQVKRLAPQKQTSAAKVREGCPRAPQKPGQRLQATPAKCSARVFSGPGLAQTPPNARVGFQEKKVEKKEEAVR